MEIFKHRECKIFWKRVITILIILSVLASTLVYADTVQAKTTVSKFDLDVYRANKYLKKGSPSNKTIKNLLNGKKLPSQVIVRDLNKKKFQKSVKKWESVHWVAKSPSEIVNGAMDKKGYYEAILLSIFISDSKMDNSLYDMAKDVTAETNQILSVTKGWVKKSDEIGMKTLSDNQKISKLSKNQKKLLKKQLSGAFAKKHPLLNKSGKIAEIFDDVFSSVDTVYDAVNKMAYYTTACELSNQNKALIELMYKNCPKSNLEMKEALRELKVSMGGFDSGIKAGIQSVAISQSSKVLSKLIDAGWKKVINRNPYVAAFSYGGKVGTKIGDSICDTLFSTNKTVEQYEKMCCLGEFQSLLSSSANKLGNIFQKNKTSANAKNYLASIDTLFATARLSCKFGLEYADILYKDAALGWVAISKKSYSKFVSDIKSMQKIYADEQKKLIKNYLTSLKDDHPSIYKELFPSKTAFKLSDEQYNMVKGWWTSCSSGGKDVKFTRTKVEYYDRETGKLAWTADIKNCKKEGETYIYYIQNSIAKYQYRLDESNPHGLDFYGTWDDANILNYYSGSSSLMQGKWGSWGS